MNLDELEGLSDKERLKYYRAERLAREAECARIREKISRGEATTEAEDILIAFMPAPHGYASSHGY